MGVDMVVTGERIILLDTQVIISVCVYVTYTCAIDAMYVSMYIYVLCATKIV